MGAVSLSPDERVLRQHVVSARFQEGMDRGRWRIVGDITWPVAMITITAGRRHGAPSEYLLRFDLAGYPDSPPTATPWNATTGDVLEANFRPKGNQVGRVFRSDWENGRALYAPFDRVALNGHSNWMTDHPRKVWNSSRDLAWLLQILHEMLNNDDYTGI